MVLLKAPPTNTLGSVWLFSSISKTHLEIFTCNKKSLCNNIIQFNFYAVFFALGNASKIISIMKKNRENTFFVKTVYKIHIYLDNSKT